MKKFFASLTIVLIEISLVLILVPSTLAVSMDDSACEVEGLSPEQKLECLLKNEYQLIEGSPQGQGEVALPSGDLREDFIPFFINTALAVAGTLIFVALLYAGFLFVTANDGEENIEKAKKIMIFAVVGAAIMAASYAFIYGLANLDLD